MLLNGCTLLRGVSQKNIISEKQTKITSYLCNLLLLLNFQTGKIPRSIDSLLEESLQFSLTIMHKHCYRVPETWKKISWRSTTLGFWFTELLERDAQFKRWCFHGRPKVF